VEQHDEALSEATGSMIPSPVQRNAATPEGDSHLDDMVQMFNSEGPWAVNWAAIAPPLKQNQHFGLKTARFGDGT
jgi:hypothetical protein